MNNFDDIFNIPAAPPAGQEFDEQNFDVDAWKEKKQLEREAAYNLIDITVGEISADGGKFKTYLDVQSKFDRYLPCYNRLVTQL